MTPAEAKAWLIGQILTEAEQSGTKLDALEARMLEYSETERTPPDLEELNEAFDRAHDQDEYEGKIAEIVRRMLAQWRAEKDPKLAQWHDAVIALSCEDHYLLVLIAAADDMKVDAANPSAKRSLLKLFLIAVAATIVMTLLLGYLVMHTR